ncbi:MAG: LysM peptidoglycan-binding domain-containing protein [Gemmatimonadota bacterium]|nr:LysM peptidoglycan-binding domain-containing protein [Gemmatimonadota bacterium]
MQRRDQEPADLHGSKESVEKMYSFAVSHRMPFYLTPTNVDKAIADGRLVALTGDSTYELTRGVGFSYSTREAKQFVLAFAPQYLAACGVPLTVTSAARPMSNQPHNANPHSVHPTGIAVDIRRPPPGPCLTWVRGALADLETRGVIEATEEHHPVHLHVAVLVQPGAKIVLPNLVRTVVARQTPIATAAPATEVASADDVSFASAAAKNAKPARTYIVRQGDTLWDIANRTGVTLDELKRANGRSASVLRAGATLTLPAGH